MRQTSTGDAPVPPAGTRILMTNHTLAMRAGSELYIRDLARELARRDYRPVVYSTLLGDVADELRGLSIPVIDDLNDLLEPPDLIHGGHHLEAMTAMLHFPRVPALYICHGFVPWEEEPPAFPTIRRYVAVDDMTAERLLTTGGVDPARIRKIRNFVDLERYPVRPDLPAKPRRVLIFSNQARGDNYGGLIERACLAEGVEQVDYMGLASGFVSAAPEEALPHYDLVFAKGRGALEAMATGCAVVSADQEGSAGLVTTANVQRLRRLNFGIRTMQDHRITTDFVRAQIAKYDPADAAEVTEWIREEASLRGAADRWESVYGEVLNDPMPGPDPASELAAASAYLRGLTPVIKNRNSDAAARYRAEFDLAQLKDELAGVRAQLQQAREQAATAAAVAEIARGELSTVRASRAWRAAERYRRASAGLKLGKTSEQS